MPVKWNSRFPVTVKTGGHGNPVVEVEIHQLPSDMKRLRELALIGLRQKVHDSMFFAHSWDKKDEATIKAEAEALIKEWTED